MALLTGKVAQEIAEMHVFSELLKRGVSVYRPVGEDALNALARHSEGHVLELKIKTNCSAGERESSVFKTAEYKPDRASFVLCVDVGEQGVEDVWVFPDMVFYAYSGQSRGKVKDRSLDLESGEKKFDAPLREYLRGFRNRWELITDYPEYREFMDSPEGFEDLEDIVTSLESFEQPEEEKIPWEEYVRSIPGTLSD